jgi:hypothetical protein
MYAMLAQLVASYHEDLIDARIALAWCTSWKPDVDGKVTLGKCKKTSDLDREFADYDFIILIRRSFWRDDRVTNDQRLALLDHELCHAAIKRDPNGEPMEDERGRHVYRVRKHDIEEFTDIVRRHGCYKADLEEFAAALRKSGVPDYEPCEQCVDTPGWVRVVDSAGAQRMARCECFKHWTEQRAEQLEAV